MRARTARRAASVGFGITAAGLAMASTAHACTTFKGSMTVTGGGGVSTTVGRGDGISHEYCQGPNNTTRPQITHGAIGTSGATITIEVAPATCGTGTNQLSFGTHQVAFNNAPAYEYTGVFPTTGYGTANKQNLCMPNSFTVPSPTAVKLTTFEVDANGAGVAQVQLPANLAANQPLEDSAVCVFPVGLVDDKGSGNMAPIHIVVV